MLKHKSPLLEEIELKVKCAYCGEVHSIVVVKNDYMNWYNGKLPIQSALPYLTADERELLLSHMCGKCYDEMIGGDEE